MTKTIVTPNDLKASGKAKRLAIRRWVQTEAGRDYVAALVADKLDAVGRPACVNGVYVDCNDIVLEEAGLGPLIKSKAGNYGRVCAGKAYMLTRKECEAAGVNPGAAND